MAAWRGIVERAGIFVFKRSFKQREVSGFCLTDDQFPVIMVNNSTPFTRQIFTLFHEVAHLLYGINSITTVDGRFVERMSGRNKSTEVACNQFAAELLIPSDTFPWQEVDLEELESSITIIASSYNVSRETILRRILDQGWVDNTTYRGYADKWVEEGDREQGGSGGTYYNNQVAYLGDSYLHLAFSRYRAGVISISGLSDHLGVKAKNIPKLEDVVYGKL